MVNGTDNIGFEGRANGEDDWSDVGFDDEVDGKSSPRFLGPLKILVGGGTMGESKVGHWKALEGIIQGGMHVHKKFI